MKIALINASDTSGGAAIACRRLTEAVNTSTNEEAILFVQSKQLVNSTIIDANPRLLKYKATANLILEKILFLPFEKNSNSRFKFSTASVGQDISQHPAIQQADIIHLHWINHSFLSLDNLKQLSTLQKPIIWTMHDKWVFTGGCHITKDCLKYELECKQCFYTNNRFGIDIANRVWHKKKEVYARLQPSFVTCSKWHKGLAHKSALLSNFRTDAIPNPINTDIYKPSNKLEARNIVGLPPDKKLILFVAANIHSTYKGFSYLLKALTQLDASENYELVVVGKGKIPSPNDLAIPCTSLQQIKEEKKLITVYNAADVLVIPSLEDNLPNTVMEALACGIPVVGFNTGGIPEMVDHLKNGYIVPQKDINGLIKGIKWVLEDPIQYQKLSENARKKVLNNYSYPIVAAQYQSLYLTVLANRNV